MQDKSNMVIYQIWYKSKPSMEGQAAL